MSIFRKAPAQNLSEWLEIATKRLGPDAKDRICTDISSHYDEAVDGHLENGLSMATSQEVALAELGDEKAAAKRFRRTHLTKYEIQQVAELLKQARRKWSSKAWSVASWSVAWYCLVWRIFFPYHGSMIPSTLAGVAIALLIVCTIANWALAARKSTVPITRLVILIQSLHELNLGILCLDLFLTGLHRATWFAWGCLLLSLLSFAMSLFFFRLRSKLGKVAEDWMGEVGEGREIPPDNPVAS